MEDILKIQREKKIKNIEYFTQFFQTNIHKTNGSESPHSLAISLLCYLSGIVNEYLRNNLFDLSIQAEPLIKQFFRSINKNR